MDPAGNAITRIIHFCQIQLLDRLPRRRVSAVADAPRQFGHEDGRMNGRNIRKVALECSHE